MRDRDQGEYVGFVTERYAALYRTAYLMTGSHETAEDVVQAALIRAFVHWSNVRLARSPSAYVRRMVVNEVISLSRRRWTREIVLEDTDRLGRAPVEVGAQDTAVGRHGRSEQRRVGEERRSRWSA